MMRTPLLVLAVSTALLYTVSAQGPGGFGAPDLSLVEQFDRNKNGRLDADERAAARAWLDRQGRTGFGFGPRGFPGGRGFAPASPGGRISPADVRAYPSTVPLYDAGTLRTFFLQFDNAAWEEELQAFYRTDVDVPATVTVDGRTYRDVGVHFRGASSFAFVPQGSKRSLNLAFDFANEQQAIGGYRSLNFLNVNGDPTFVRPVLYSTIARAYIPAPAANYVRVVINGEDWGVYVSTQQFNRDFLRDAFKTTEGARWRVPGSPAGRGGMEYWGDDPAPYKTTYEIRTRDSRESWAALIRMFKVLNETPADRLEAALSPLLDIDGALKFLALEVALVNSDGYWARASDYSLYLDPQGRFHVVPHDMNEGLAEERGFGGRGGRGRPGGPGGLMFPDAGVDLDPLVGLDDASKPLRSKLLAVPGLRAKYLGYVRDIAEKWLDWGVVGPMARQQQALIAEAVRVDTRKLYTTQAFESGLERGDESLKTFLERRRAFLLEKTPAR